MNPVKLSRELSSNTYPGRGIVLGKSQDGRHAAIAYFIMGRSENSRNRIFSENDRGGIKTEAFDPAKLVDPSLIIYNPVLVLGDATIVTYCDQTDTVYDFMKEGKSFDGRPKFYSMYLRRCAVNVWLFLSAFHFELRQRQSGFRAALLL